MGEVYRTGAVKNLDMALASLRSTPHAVFVSDGIDYRLTNGSLTQFLGDDARSLSNASVGAISDAFVLRLSGQIYLEAGTHRFHNTTDDGFRLTIGGETAAEYGDPRGSDTTRGVVEISRAGWYTINIDYFEAWHDAQLEIRHSLNGGAMSYLNSSRLRFANGETGGGQEPETPVEPRPNTAPDARNDARVLDEDGSVTLNPLANDVDADGDSLRLVSIGSAANGTVTRNADGTVTYRPNANFNGQDSFTYQISDGRGGTDSARVNLTINAVNDAPVATNDGGFSVHAGQVLAINIADLLANDRDVDGDVLNLVRLTNITNGTAQIVGNQIRFEAEAEGQASFRYVINDGNGGTSSANVRIDVAAAMDDGDNGHEHPEEPDDDDDDDGGHTGGGDDDHGSGDGHGGSHELIDPPSTPAEIAAFVAMVRAMPEHDMGGNSAAMQMHMAALDLVSRADATHIAINHGDWNDASTWHNGRVPGNDAKVLIPEGISVGYSAENSASIHTLRIDGELHFATDEDSRLVVDTIVVSPTGRLEIGTAGDPVEAGTTVDIVFADNGNIDVNWDPSLLSRGMIAMGEVDISGVEKSSHLKVQVDAMAGDRQLTLAESPTGWQVGDKLVLTGTYQQGFYWNSGTGRMDFAESQDEEVYITAIRGNTVTLNRPLTYDHDTPRDDLKAYVANMSRNVTFSSEGGDDLPSHQRGHVMFMHNDDVDVRYAGFEDLGRTDKSAFAGPASAFGGVGNLRPNTNVEARYPFHFHEAGVDDIENPAIALGNVVDGSPGWGFVHHSSNANLTNNVAFDVFGAAFVAEDGNETGTWYRNIAIKSQGVSAGDVSLKESEHDGNDARTGDGFWFGGRLVQVIENVAANTTHGFSWLHRGDRDGINPDTMYNSEVANGRDRLGPDKAPIAQFRDNEAFGTNTGLIVVKENPDQGHDLRSVFDGFLNWETREGIAMSYTGHYTFLDIDLIGQRPDNGVAWQDAYYGVNLGGNAFDMVFNDIRIDGFRNGIVMTDNNDVNTGRSGDFHNVVIDAEYRNISGSNVLESYRGQLQSLSGSDLTPGRLNFRQTSDRVISDNEGIFLDGIKTDSIGSTERSYVLEQQGLWPWEVPGLLQEQGFWRLPNGTAVVLVEDYIADRATGELAKTMQVFELTMSASSLARSYTDNGVLRLGGPAPVTRADSAVTMANTTVRIDLVANDHDPDGGRVYVDGLTNPLHGDVFLQDDGTVIYRPDHTFTGRDHFYYWAADDEGNVTRGEAVVTVGPAGSLLESAMGSDSFTF